MSIFVKASLPLPPKTTRVTSIALLYAAALVVLAVAQLYSFDEFLPLVRDFALPGGIGMAYFLAAFIVVAEVFALPFLLRMRLSPAMRVLSMVMGWVVAAFWLKITLWLLVTASTVTNIGLLGTTFEIAPSYGIVLVGLAFAILATWASWGMWPIPKRK